MSNERNKGFTFIWSGRGLSPLPISGVLYTFSDNSYWLLAGGQAALDGVGAGIYGAISDYRCRSHA
jgi:hypothetical protein